MNRDERKALFQEVDVYPVTCQRLSAGRTNREVLEEVLRGGAKIVQLREKELSTLEFYRMALEFRERTAAAGVLLLINDRLDIALAVEADGVHLGLEDLPLAVARRLAPEMLLGASTHSIEEALEAQENGADYINVGPIFPTGTKEGIKKFLGPRAVTEIGARVRVPFTVMGGINESNLDQVLSAGARRVAMVTAITQAPDIAERVRSLRRRIAAHATG
ncbi:MAG TPA: thiamine phosphate synthase [Syntrophobacteraceae bacterium]|nr:thiamine phosphate synthase [Syntrophobacteraceae bacterium]